MKFLIDEQLPPLLAQLLQNKGHDAVHVLTLGTNISVSDTDIRKISMSEERIVITKDDDFFNSYIFQHQPYKLILITTGNIKNRALLDLFRKETDIIIGLLHTSSVIEINQTDIKIWF